MPSSALSVVFISYRAATPEGDGGNHRTYQMLQDLQQAFGRSNVHSVAIEDWSADHEWRPLGRRPNASRRIRHRLSRMTENPYRLLTREGWSHHTRFGTRGVLSQEFIEYVLERVPAPGTYDACLVDHAMFDEIRRINANVGTPTVIATHNIESLDLGRMHIGSVFAAQRAGVDFANEMRALSNYAERLAISKTEASVLTGIGLSCQYYPYVPAGQVRDNLARICAVRQTSEPDRNLFLLLGTASHAPTRRSLAWFLNCAREQGLPGGARIAVVGSNVDQLLAHDERVTGIEVLGRVPDEELFDLLTHVGAALVPQRMGFGALTRIPELACAGVPMLVFPHASYAIDPPPGVHTLRTDSWACMVEGMQELMYGRACPTVAPDAYSAWERKQSRPLGPAIATLVGSTARGLRGAHVLAKNAS
jgi:hypothetical protein